MLTHIQVTTAKPSTKAYALYDGLGLHLRVQTTGSKLWRMNYRFLGKQKTLHIGKWPAVGLAEARAKREEARKQLAAGIDPSVEKKRARVAARYAAANTFQAVAEEWLLKCERDGLAANTREKLRWLLAKSYPMIGSIHRAQGDGDGHAPVAARPVAPRRIEAGGMDGHRLRRSDLVHPS